MMTSIKTGLVSLLVLAGSGTALAELPEMTAEYVGEAQYMWEDKVVDATIRAKGELMRVDIAADQLGTSMGTSIIMDFENTRFISFPTGDVAENMRFYMELTDDAYGLPEEGVVAAGQDTVAGIRCTNYESIQQSATGEILTNQNCISSDGIWLKSVEGGQTTVFEMTSVSLGTQPSILFTPPAGYSEMDLSAFGDLDPFGTGDDDEEDSKIKQMKDETKQQVEDRVDTERRQKVDKFLGKIFGN